MKPLLIALALIIGTSTVAQAQNRKVHTVRESAGRIEVTGWEHDLIRRDPNLGHWHWTPMYANLDRTRSWTDADKAGVAKRVASAPTIIPKPHYVKPIHIPLPLKRMTPQMGQMPANQPSAGGSNSNNSRSDVNGTLISRSNPPTATYGGDYTRGNSGLVSERTSVRGRLAPGWRL